MTTTNLLGALAAIALGLAAGGVTSVVMRAVGAWLL